MYDAIIIGAGVTGCAIARELSRYQLNILVLEKEEDVCCGTSKANSAIIHAGHDAKPGSLKARFNVRGNELMDQLSADLDFPFTRNGSLVLCFEESQIPELEGYQVPRAGTFRRRKGSACLPDRWNCMSLPDDDRPGGKRCRKRRFVPL